MPNLADFIRSEKSDLKFGDWHHGKIPRVHFPMSGAKARAYKYGPAYCWQVITFKCLDRLCRVLIILNEEKHQFRAAFGVDKDGDTILLCDHEFHGDHPGWHCHLTRADVDAVEPGSNRLAKKRWPGSRSQHSKKDFGLTKENARLHTLARYRIDAKGPLL